MRQEVIDEIRELENEEGRLTAETVVERARSENSTLHGYFDWDDKEAADKWRLEQAGQLIRRVRPYITYERVNVRSIGYVRDPEAEGPGYRSTAKLRTERERAAEAMLYEIERAEAACNRAQKVAISLGLECDVSDLMAELQRLKNLMPAA